MALKPPPEPEHLVALTAVKSDWVRCTSCSRALFYIYDASGYIIMNFKCPSCGKIFRLVIGIIVESS